MENSLKELSLDVRQTDLQEQTPAGRRLSRGLFFAQKGGGVFKISAYLSISIFPNCLPRPPNLFCSPRHEWRALVTTQINRQLFRSQINEKNTQLENEKKKAKRKSLFLRSFSGCTASSPPLSDSFIASFFGDHSYSR